MNQKDQFFSQQAVELALEFNRYLIEHPEVTETIGNQANIFFEVEGDEAFNQWSRRLAEQETSNGNLVWVKIKKLRPIRSRIEEFELMSS